MPQPKAPYDYRLNKPFICKISKKIQERNDVVSLVFKYDPIDEPIIAKPGQFLMIWLPGNDEIPMSISHIYGDGYLAISVANVGDTTHRICQLNVGDEIGVRGPYGTNFELITGTDQVAIVIGGGIGTAAVLPLVYQIFLNLSKYQTFDLHDAIFLEGVKTSEELLYKEEINNICKMWEYYEESKHTQFCTDDGSFGFSGYPTQRLIDYIERNTIDGINITVYACGPEIMLQKVFQICEKYNIACQLSLERMMRCGFGICGLCALEPSGLLVCRDGPVFTNKDLRECTDFGKFHRDFSGKEIPL